MSELREAVKAFLTAYDERVPLNDDAKYVANQQLLVVTVEALRQALTKEVESGWIETTLNGFDWDGTPNGTIIVSFEIPYQEVTTGEAWSLARQSPPQQQGEGRAGLVSEQSSASNESEEVR